MFLSSCGTSSSRNGSVEKATRDWVAASMRLDSWAALASLPAAEAAFRASRELRRLGLPPWAAARGAMERVPFLAAFAPLRPRPSRCRSSAESHILAFIVTVVRRTGAESWRVPVTLGCASIQWNTAPCLLRSGRLSLAMLMPKQVGQVCLQGGGRPAEGWLEPPRSLLARLRGNQIRPRFFKPRLLHSKSSKSSYI